jgi:hypothetical protein
MLGMMKWWSLEQRCCQAPGRRVVQAEPLRHRHLSREDQMGPRKVNSHSQLLVTEIMVEPFFSTPFSTRAQMAGPLVHKAHLLLFSSWRMWTDLRLVRISSFCPAQSGSAGDVIVVRQGVVTATAAVMCRFRY